MKNLNNIAPTMHSKFWLLAVNIFLMLMISSCSSSSNSPPAFTPQNTLDGKVLVIGSQVDSISGDLVMYVTGTDLDGIPLTVAQLQTATVKVDAASYTNGDGNLAITAVAGTEDILSLSLVADWSNSTNGELQFVSGIFTQLLDSLPAVFEAQVSTFSDDLEIQQDWTTDLALLKAGVLKAHSVRNKTALYDSMGEALEADPGDLTEADGGIIDRCRPAHMMVVFTDGDDNMSSVYTASGLADIVNLDKTVVIMLGTSDALPAVLTTLAGDYGAVVQVNDPSGLPVEVDNFTASLNNMVAFTLDSAINIVGKTLSITLGTQTAVVEPNLHCAP